MFGKSMNTDVNHKIIMRKPKPSEEIINYVQGRLASVFSSPKIKTKTDKELQSKGLILGTLGLIGMKLDISASVNDDEARLKVMGKTTRGPLFWITWVCSLILVIGALASNNFIGLMLAIVVNILEYIMLKSVQNKPKELVDKLIQEVDVEFR